MSILNIGTHKVKKSDFNKWLRALRSGEYKQAQHFLQTDEGYCCLGVACKLFIPSKFQKLNSYGQLQGALPRAQPNAPDWLRRINDDFQAKTGVNLDLLNDKGLLPVRIHNYRGLPKFTFEEIADLLEAVYVYKVLD